MEIGDRVEYKIVNREPNFINTQLVYMKNNISGVDRGMVDKMIRAFDEVRKIDNTMVSSNDLREVSERIKSEHLTKVRTLKKEENRGFVAIGSLTVFTILLLAFVIFTTIKSVIIK